jgi:hypothetical protein
VFVIVCLGASTLLAGAELGFASAVTVTVALGSHFASPLLHELKATAAIGATSTPAVRLIHLFLLVSRSFIVVVPD